MNMRETIYTKVMPDSVKFELLDIARRDNQIEELIDLVIEKSDNTSEVASLEDDVQALEKKVDELENELSDKNRIIDNMMEVVKGYRQDINNRIQQFNEFCTNFINQHNRYSSIDET